MAEPEKPFVCYRQGLSIKFYARGAAGLKSLACWIGGYLLVILLFIMTVAKHPHSRLTLPALTMLLVGSTIWVICMYRWLLARSDVIDNE